MPRTWRDDSPRGNKKPPAQRSPGLSESYYANDGPVRRDFSPDGPRGPARRRYPREEYDDPAPERPLRHSSPHGPHSPAPRYQKSKPEDPHRRHRRRRTADDDDPAYDDQRHRGRDERRKQTWNPGQGQTRREMDDYLPPRYRSTTASPPARRDRRSATYPEPRRERVHSPSRDYDDAPRSRRRDTRDARGRGRDDLDEPPRRRRGRARSLDSDDGFRSKESPRNKIIPAPETRVWQDPVSEEEARGGRRDGYPVGYLCRRRVPGRGECGVQGEARSWSLDGEEGDKGGYCCAGGRNC